MQQRVSAKDVADLAGVSRAAVSRTFGKGQVSADVRKRVLAAAQELGYRPNAIARSLLVGRSELIALVIAEQDSMHNGGVIERLIVGSAMRGKRALVIPVLEDADVDESILKATDYQVDAIVVIGGTVSPKIVERLSRTDVPLFLYERVVNQVGVECVTCDGVLGAQLAARYLLRCGHERISFITKSRPTFANRSRRSGLEKELAEAGTAIFSEATGEQGFNGGFAAASELFSMRDLPDALFCFNDEMALGALQAAATMKLKVPDDVAIIGFDDIPMAAWPVFNLTTMHNPVRQPADLLLDRLVARLEGAPPADAPHRLAPELIVRGTTR